MNGYVDAEENAQEQIGEISIRGLLGRIQHVLVEGDSTPIWLYNGVWGGWSVSHIENSLCDQPSDRVREPLRSLKSLNRSFSRGLTHELTRRGRFNGDSIRPVILKILPEPFEEV